MRILANYGYKNNGDSYSVTFETVGDVPKEHSDSVVDELFGMAKRAIERQIHSVADAEVSASRSDTTKNNSIRDPLGFPPQEKHDIAIPEPKKNLNGNGSASYSNGNKHQLKDPGAPATPKQKSFIVKLAKERGQFIDGLNSYTMQDASEKIAELMAV